MPGFAHVPYPNAYRTPFTARPGGTGDGTVDYIRDHLLHHPRVVEGDVAARFAAFARANILGTTGLSSLHGALFEVLVGTGLLGLIPWAGAIGWTLARLLSLPGNAHPWFRSPVGRSIQAEMLGVLVLVLVRASTSSGLAMHQDNFMLFLTVLAYASSMRNATRSSSDDERSVAIAQASA